LVHPEKRKISLKMKIKSLVGEDFGDPGVDKNMLLKDT
jgi:hypothetical protein